MHLQIFIHLGSDSESSPSQEDREVLDHIISTLHYCRLEYKPRSICIAGVGMGASWAASASCDLWDLASLALQQISNDHKDVDQKNIDKTNNKNTKKNTNVDTTARAVLLEDEDKATESSTSTPRIHLGYAAKVIIDKSRQHQFEAELEFINNQHQHEKEKQLQSTSDRSEGTLLSTTQQVLTVGTAIEEMNTDESVANDDKDNDNDEYDLSKVDSSGIVDSIMKKIMRDTNDNNSFDNTTTASTNTAPSVSMSEKQAKRTLTDSERKEYITRVQKDQEQLDRTSHEKSVQSAVTRQLFNAAHSTLSVSDIVYLAPRALLCLHPTNTASAQELQRLGSGLRLPAAIMCSGSDEDR